MNGKGKGNKGERIVCKILTKWITGKDKPYVFWRSANSGGLATTLNMYDDLSGDIIAIRPEGKIITNIFSLEIKTGYTDTNIDKCLKYNKNENLRDFWIQCCNDAKKANKNPMLIYNRKGELAKNMWIGLCNKGLMINENFSKLCKLSYVMINFDEKYNLPTINLFNFQEFMDFISLKDLKEIMKHAAG